MAKPIWITPAGSLGVIPEGVFFQLPILAYDPDGGTLYYEVIAGSLPDGIQCAKTGLIVGIPSATISVQGVPLPVNRDITSKFATRVYTTKIVNGIEVVDRLTDRTFTITVSGQNAPEFTTPAGQVAQVYDGGPISPIQIDYTDADPSDILVVKLVAGSLPTGLTISNTGLITGYVVPLSDVYAQAGFSCDGQGYSRYPFDFSTQSISKNYEFTLEVTDGKSNDLRTFSIYVISKNSLTADNTELTSDNTFVTADVSPVRIPFITTPSGSIGRVRSDNWYAFEFKAIDFDGDQVQWLLSSGSLPPGLTLDINSGYIYGYIPSQGLTEIDYNFSLRVYKKDNIIDISDPVSFSLTLLGDIDTEVTWLTPGFLGTIDNGGTSEFYIEAISAKGYNLQYELKSGSNSLLPQGLSLLSSGNIVGKVTFDVFSLDNNTTTFDVTKNNLVVGIDSTETTFDRVFTFTVNAFTANGFVSVDKVFKIKVLMTYNTPYENLYIKAMPPQNDRDLINSLLQNSDIFQPEFLYRADDPNFGRATEVVYWHAYGLTASILDDYVNAVQLNHYWKNLTLGEIKTAQATDSAGNVVYEVVYSQIVDDLVNNQGQSVGKQVAIPYPINAEDSTEIDLVYPNSLINMRNQVIDQVGQVSRKIPLWMQSKQSDGKILGFVPAWVIAYTKPGRANQVVYYINEKFNNQINKIDFKADRYELDRSLSHNWNPETQSWVPAAAATTFDIQNHYQLPEPNDSSFAFNGGVNYATGDQIYILGSQVGGEDIVNDIIVVVEAVNENGTVEQARANGLAPFFSAGQTYLNVVGANISGVGSGATWDIVVVPGAQTTFDEGSMQFIAPVDIYTNTDEYDKYIMFPKQNILGQIYYGE
jgi:hypothetical protein